MNQDQRELLELAAYAIGYKIGCRGCGTWGCVGECEWNPLTNKADAFDLVVKLNLAVQQLPGRNKPAVEAWHNDNYAREMWNGSPETATMLAITRAAAAIGKQMKERNRNAE